MTTAVQTGHSNTYLIVYESVFRLMSPHPSLSDQTKQGWLGLFSLTDSNGDDCLSSWTEQSLSAATEFRALQGFSGWLPTKNTLREGKYGEMI